LEEHQTNNKENANKRRRKNSKIKAKTSITTFDSSDGEDEILKDIGSSINKSNF
jgi:hypothetical protein